MSRGWQLFTLVVSAVVVLGLTVLLWYANNKPPMAAEEQAQTQTQAVTLEVVKLASASEGLTTFAKYSVDGNICVVVIVGTLGAGMDCDWEGNLYFPNEAP